MIDKYTEEPLVSIIVITYNSAKYVLETLESAKAQTYPNIELIVSDDCSTDNTIELCNKWIKKNKKRFVKVQFITSERNTGISPNCNRGVNVADGEWIKIIAGDDILNNRCIELNIFYANKNKDANFLFSKSAIIQNDKITDKIIYSNFFNLNKKMQRKLLLLSNQFSTTSAFINKKILFALNRFNERYPMIEDYPLWVKAINSNYNFYGFNELTCYYRVHDNNISLSQDSVFNIKQYNSLKIFIINNLLKENIFQLNILNIIYNLYFMLISELIILNKNKKYIINIKLMNSVNFLKSIIYKFYNILYK